MINVCRRKLARCQAIAAIVVKQFLAYPTWFWARFCGQIITIFIFIHFWRAVYANSTIISNVRAEQAINYIILAQLFLPILGFKLILDFSAMVKEGRVSIEMLRPLDLQTTFFINELTVVLCSLVLQALPIGMMTSLIFELDLPSNLLTWACFIVSLLLGHAILFFFDWSLACMAFYTTETWGLHVLRVGIALFFSGAFVPLAMFPGWLQAVAQALPFRQALYIPISLLTEIQPLTRAPQILSTQIVWLVSLALVSRLIFRLSVRKVTVQGG